MTTSGKQTARDHLGDRGFTAEPIYLSDLDRCTPAEGLSTEAAWRHWRVVDYKTDALSGSMLLAEPETAAPPVTYPLDVAGWHAVSIGVYGCPVGGTSAAGPDRIFTQLLVKATSESTFSILTLPPVERVHGQQLTEVFWRVIDLTGQGLVLGQPTWRLAPGDHPGCFSSSPAKIGYIKLVPLSDPEVAGLKAERDSKQTRRIFVHNDAHGIHSLHRPTTAEEIRRRLEPYRDTDISRLYWECGMGDIAYHLSKIARIPTYDGVTDFGPQQVHNYRLGAESWRAFRDQGVDPFRVALDHAHDLGLEFHASYRVAGFHFPPMHDHFDHGASFYDAHPELRGYDRNGGRTPRLSYAYPEVRRFVMSMLREVAGHPIDGICVLYNRRPPVVEYEPPVVERFQAEFGEDPRQLDERDPRWLAYRARTLTQFMRELREAMDQVAEEQGRADRIEVSAVVMSSEEENLYNAMDLASWVSEGLVDTLIPYTSLPNLEGLDEAWTDVRALDYFISITDGTACTLAPNLMPRQMSAEQYRRRAAALYEAGVENLFFWDCDILQARLEDLVPWHALCRLGHRDEIQAWQRAGEPSLDAPSMAFRRLGDWDLSYATPG